MPQMSVAANPELAKRLLRDAEAKPTASTAPPPPVPVQPSETVFHLAGGYLQTNGQWTNEFEVRELNGRDEEYLGRIKDSSRLFIGMLSRGLVRVGGDRANDEVIDSLLAGDWETVLIAIRIATFGKDVEIEYKCKSCGEPYEVKFDLRENLSYKEADQNEIRFEVVGRHGIRYVVSHCFGSTQRKLLTRTSESIPELNSMLLLDSILKIGDLPPLGMDSIRDLPLADRREILSEIESRRVGPEFKEVRTECPTCGVEQPSLLNIAALFQF